jgi:hypothetical protein
MQQCFWGYFHKKILRLTLIVSYIELFIFILNFVVLHQNDIATTKIWSKAGWTGQGRKFFLQTPKSKIDKNHSYAIFPYKNNNHIFYDYSEINQRGLPPVHTFTQEYHRIPKNTPILPKNTLRGPVNIPDRLRNK